MKRWLVFGAFFLVYLNLVSLAKGACSCQEDQNPAQISFRTVSSSLEIFADEGFEEPAVEFLPGQKLWVRVENNGNGESQHQLRLLDAEKKEIQKIVLNRSGSGPYLYTASLLAPAEAGIYYLDVRIEGDGSNFNSQRNIMVAGEGSSVSVSSRAESIAMTNIAGETGKPKESSVIEGSEPLAVEIDSETEEGTPEPLSWRGKVEQFRQGVINFFRNFLSYLTVSLK